MTADLRALLARHPAPWKAVGDEEFGYEWVEGANGVKVFDDGTAGGEYGRACKPETMALIVSAVNALPGLLDEVERLRADLAEAVGLTEKCWAVLTGHTNLGARAPELAREEMARQAAAFLAQHEGGRDE